MGAVSWKRAVLGLCVHLQAGSVQFPYELKTLCLHVEGCCEVPAVPRLGSFLCLTENSVVP